MGYAAKILLGLAAMAAAFGVVLWALWKSLKKSYDPGSLLVKWIVTVVVFGMLIYLGVRAGSAGWGGAFIIPITGACLGIILGIMWAPSNGALLATPLMELYEGGEASEPKPLYSIAQAKRKQGKYRDAQTEVRKQLAKFPNDFEGWMLMGEIFARDFKDTAGASQCVDQIISSGEHTPRNVAFALTCLADWRLEIDHDRDAAREALERILELYPDTEQSHLAAQRIAHLSSKEMLQQQIDRPKIALKTFEGHPGLQTDPSQMPDLPPEDFAAKASELVRHLDEHPLDNDARETLAGIYADHYHRPELAAEQLEQLINTPNQPQKYVVHCLNRLVDVYVRVACDEASARQTLERILLLFPGTAAAANAEKRMTLLPAEMKRNVSSQSVAMGVYDQDIGLKGKVPKRFAP
jgi:tetratricopeptide (TPR) repeat protein